VDQLQACSPNVEPLYYTTRFIDGIKNDIKYFIVVERPKDLDTACCLTLLQEEHRAIQPKELKYQGPGNHSRLFIMGALPLPRPPVTSKVDLGTGDKTKLVNAKGQSVKNKIVALTIYKMAKGLCVIPRF
jgi:hypothetical protein